MVDLRLARRVMSIGCSRRIFPPKPVSVWGLGSDGNLKIGKPKNTVGICSEDQPGSSHSHEIPIIVLGFQFGVSIAVL